MDTLLLLETASQVAWLAGADPDRVKYPHCLAITPTAAFACQAAERPYLKLEDHAQVSKRPAEYSSILAEYLEWETWLDHWLQARVPEFAASQFTPVRNTTFLLQLLHAEIWSTTISFREFLDETCPAHLALWQPGVIRVPWFLQPSVSPLTMLGPAVAQARNIDVVNLADRSPELAAVSQVEPGPRFSRRTARWLRQQIHTNQIVAEFVALRTIGLTGYLKQRLSVAPHIFVSGSSHDLGLLVSALRRQGERVTQWPDELPPARLFTRPPRVAQSLAARLTPIEQQLFKEPNFWKPIEQHGLGRLSLWSEPLRFWWRQIVPESWSRVQHLRRSFTRRSYAALVTWDAGSNTLSSAALNAAASTRVPRYIYQHGGSAHSDAKIWQMYLRQSDVFLAYGEETIAELNNTRPPYLEPSARLTPIGSARLDSIRTQHDPETSIRVRTQLQSGDPRPIILYIPSHFGGYGRAISDLAAYPDVSYFELQQKILSLWATAPKVRLLYKHFVVANDLNHIMPDFIEKHIPNASITTQRLTELMWTVDAIVLDHAITALGEVLLTDKPLIVYMPKLDGVVSRAAALLSKRATVAETPFEFEAHVRALLQADQYTEVTKPNTEFLQAYCTHLNDRHSAERAAAVILKGFKRN
jgi:hypothetical protein